MLQHWDRPGKPTRPEGTVEERGFFVFISRSFGTRDALRSDPNAEALGYFQVSLPDTLRLIAG